MEKEIITQIIVRDDHGMNQNYSVGKYGVKEIKEHTARGDGDKWFYDVLFEDGDIKRIFDFIETTRKIVK